jgi:hypothetical protein
MSEGGIEVAGGQMKDFDIDQLAASVALIAELGHGVGVVRGRH